MSVGLQVLPFIDNRHLGSIPHFQRFSRFALFCYDIKDIFKLLNIYQIFSHHAFLSCRRYGIEIRDFGKSWRDGVAFTAMVHTIRPDLVDVEQAKKQSARLNLENAFSTAENHLGIPRLIDPEGMLGSISLD